MHARFLHLDMALKLKSGHRFMLSAAVLAAKFASDSSVNFEDIHFGDGRRQDSEDKVSSTLVARVVGIAMCSTSGRSGIPI